MYFFRQIAWWLEISRWKILGLNPTSVILQFPIAHEDRKSPFRTQHMKAKYDNYPVVWCTNKKG